MDAEKLVVGSLLLYVTMDNVSSLSRKETFVSAT